MHRVLNFGTCPDENAVVMDFFGGSGTFSQAVLELNSSGARKLRYILVQWPEKTPKGSASEKAGFDNIAEITKERIRRVGKQILEGTVHPNWNRDTGFRTLKIDTSNMQDVYYRPDQIDQTDLLAAIDNVKPDRTAEDLLFQVLIDWGVEDGPALPILKEVIEGKTVFYVNKSPHAGPDLLACFDKGITEELVKKLAETKPLRAVFRDNGFVSDVVKINVVQIFRQISPKTEVKSI
jgi:adenine-specific DNA-methyltransferase